MGYLMPDTLPADGVTSRVACGSHGDAPRWYCAWTHPNEERRALDSLTNVWETYLPMHLSRGDRVNRRPDRIVPLFPRYMFIRFDAVTEPWGSIQHFRGVGGLIRHGAQSPTPLPPGVIEHLIERTSCRGIVDDPGDNHAPANIPTGAAVTVVGGAFHGLRGIVALSAPDRCKVLLSMFRASVPVNVRTADLVLDS
jgi:transcriptional antiterminator RfaH